MHELLIHQYVRILNTGRTHEILATTNKAIDIAISDGRWGGDGARHLWIPRSLITQVNYTDAPDGSSFGTHDIEIVKWFIENNAKKLK